MFPIISNVLKNGLVHQPRLSFMNCCTSSLLLNILNLPLMFGQLLNSPMKVSMLSPIMFITVSKSNYCISGPSLPALCLFPSEIRDCEARILSQSHNWISQHRVTVSQGGGEMLSPRLTLYTIYILYIWSQWAQSTGKINAAQLNQIHDYHPVKP